MSFKGMDTNEQMRDFHKFLDEFDDILVKQGVKHSMAWFKKKDIKDNGARTRNRLIKSQMLYQLSYIPYS